MTHRLSKATLASVAGRPDVRGPAVDPGAATVGVVHLGVGAFHRAHQAVFTEDAAAAAGEDRWGIFGVTPRSRRVADQLVPQDGLYSVLTKGADSTSMRVIGSMRDVAHLGSRTPDVLAAIAAPTTHVVSSTVSEKGYHRAPDGRLDLGDDAVAADLATLRAELTGGWSDDAAHTPVGAIARGLARRAEHGTPLSVLCCDNMVDNGHVLRGLVTDLLEAAGADVVRAWAQDAVRYPLTMVDRITPATTDAHRAEATRLLGLRDEGLVVAEPFSQWVIEDSFAGPRPRWELAGAILAPDVRPYERAKLRMLNGTHSAVAYLGALRGHRLIDEALGDPEVAGLARRLLDEDVMPTLEQPQGVDLAEYRDSILSRFANPSTGYTTLQVAGDGSQKLPMRILGTVADRLAAGVVPEAAVRTLAAWMVFVARGRDVAGRELPLDDPLADQLREAASGDDAGLADRMLALRAVFPEALAEDDRLRTALRTEVASVQRLLT
ncbi:MULTISPECIES: mannitol dehydrogenase family protein [unclassified Actinotalea]|uniref:mannitol dehydrogenase family protein n=1 Tax=unclassified Actinotalea TaxID=2638618 RepID=UPI0015F53C21|nr:MULTISPECIES: mannitol dehydrogenase family protein [unclassified Actinotalea]